MSDEAVTLREHLEAIRDRHLGVMTLIYRDQPNFPEGVEPERWCDQCEDFSPCADYSDAVAALAILDEADEFNRAVANSPRDEHGEPTYIRYRLVLDPERPAATPTTTEAADA